MSGKKKAVSTAQVKSYRRPCTQGVLSCAVFQGEQRPPYPYPYPYRSPSIKVSKSGKRVTPQSVYPTWTWPLQTTIPSWNRRPVAGQTSDGEVSPFAQKMQQQQKMPLVSKPPHPYFPRLSLLVVVRGRGRAGGKGVRASSSLTGTWFDDNNNKNGESHQPEYAKRKVVYVEDVVANVILWPVFCRSEGLWPL